MLIQRKEFVLLRSLLNVVALLFIKGEEVGKNSRELGRKSELVDEKGQ
jgi:hypothetical protein